MAAATYIYKMPTYIDAPASRFDVATNIAHFLMAQGLSIFDKWQGKITAADQRKIFGVKLGKGIIVVDGENDRAENRSQTCFGGDTEATVVVDCAGKDAGVWRNFWSPSENTPHELEINATRDWF
jgi:hypothetical protein